MQFADELDELDDIPEELLELDELDELLDDEQQPSASAMTS